MTGLWSIGMTVSVAGDRYPSTLCGLVVLCRLLAAAQGQAVEVPRFCPAQRLPGMIDIKALPAQTAVL